MGGISIPGMRFSSKEKATEYLEQRKAFYREAGLEFVGSEIEDAKPKGYVKLYARWRK